MPIRTRSRAATSPRFRPQTPQPACRNHATQPAVREGLCKNCLFFRDHGKMQALRSEKASKPAAGASKK